MRKKVLHTIGNILDAPEDILVQQVNCKGAMGSGLAKQLRDKYPKMYEEYKRYCGFAQNPEALLGTVHWYNHDPEETGKPLKRVANIFGQLYYGRDPDTVYTDYDAVAKALIEVSQRARTLKLTTAIPYKMGCGLGGGDWKTILAMIESRETFVNQFVKIYRLEE